MGHPDSVRTPIDAFLLAALEAKGATFSPEADRRTLIRRASFDLLGLPPTPEDVEAFAVDKAPDAYERLIDRLLDSRHYGERWARHWLDVAGYADSDGDPTRDTVRPYAYKYRDYLIRSLNGDRPWDILIREQLAGDEMIASSLENLDPADHDRLVATGFLRMAPDTTAEKGVDQVQARNDAVAETIKVVSTSLLGLTVGCAQCHSHRYDPITHEDYYRFRALFEPAFDVARWKTPAQRLVSLWSPEDRRRAEVADVEIKAIERERQVQIDALVVAVFEKELAEAREEVRSKLREAFETPAKERTAEQKDLLRAYPQDARHFRERQPLRPQGPRGHHGLVRGAARLGASEAPRRGLRPCPDRDPGPAPRHAALRPGRPGAASPGGRARGAERPDRRRRPGRSSPRPSTRPRPAADAPRMPVISPAGNTRSSPASWSTASG